jgi:hypothetical protein
MSAPVQVFGRRQRRSNHALRRPASEKRQGTKSREGDDGDAAGYGDFTAGSGVDETELCSSGRELAKCRVPDWGAEGAAGLLLAAIMSFDVVRIAEIGLKV